MFQKKFGRHNLLPHYRRSLHWLRIQDDFLIVKCDKNLGPAIIEREIYIERVYRDHIYQRDKYLYLPPALAPSKMESLKLEFVDWIKRQSKQLTRMGKCFLTTNLKANVDPFPWFYRIIKNHKTLWTMRPIISYTDSLIHPIVVCIGSKFQQLEADMPSYFKEPKLRKEKLTTIELPPRTIDVNYRVITLFSPW